MGFRGLHHGRPMAYCSLLVATRNAIRLMRIKHRNVGPPSTKGEGGEEREVSKESILQGNMEDGMT